MTIAKYCSVVILIYLNMSCKNMDNEYFQVFGKNELLEKCKINLVKIDEVGNESIHNILCNGKLNQIKAENESASIYKFYFSYNDNYIELLNTENIFRNASDKVNNLYIEEKDSIIYIKFVGRKSDIGKDDIFRKALIDKEKYYEANSISHSDLSQINSLFFVCK